MMKKLLILSIALSVTAMLFRILLMCRSLWRCDIAGATGAKAVSTITSASPQVLSGQMTGHRKNKRIIIQPHKHKTVKTTYISPRTETFKLLSVQNLLQGSPDSTLEDLAPNGIIDEGF